MRADTRAVVIFLLAACIPAWIGWSLLTFGVVPQNAPYALPLYLTGWSCSIGGLLATYAGEGRGGVARLLRSAVHVKLPLSWWLYALSLPLAMQTCIALVTFMLLRTAPAVHPAALLSLATPAMLLPFFMGPFGEEFGWRGVLLPSLVRRMPVLPACLAVGLIWALWHWPLQYQQLGPLIGACVCMSFMIAALYLRTRSVLLAMIMHWSFNAMGQLSPSLFPGVAAGDSSTRITCASLGVMAVFAALALPALLSFRPLEEPQSFGQEAKLPGMAAGD